MKNSPLAIIAFIVGFALIGLAALYWSTPAGSLPAYIPGYAAGSTTIHIKHGIASLLLGLGAWVLAWFKSGKKTT